VIFFLNKKGVQKMAHITPQFNIKTGSDSTLYFSREVTSGDVSVNPELQSALGRIKKSVQQESDVFNYPQLTRRTGHSIKGSTESIESNELRKGRTKSAPRKGSSSSEGSLDIELSPETYDDIFEATFRNKWKPWKSDADSSIKFDFDKPLATDQFISNGTEKDAGLQAKYLVGVANTESKDAVVVFETPAERASYEIDELTCGTEDIKYSALAQYGGITGEDLYQEFKDLAVNTMSLSVSPGQIVTGSFGFMGANNPELLRTGDEYVKATTFEEGVSYYKSTGDGYVFAEPQPTSQGDIDNETYFVPPTGIIESLADDVVRDKKGRFYESVVDGEVVGKNPKEVKDWIDDLANKKATSTDQFTAREGFLYINGHRIQYGSNLTFELNNGLKQIYAIFERDSISTTPLSLDITGTLDAYLIAGHSEDLYNMCARDKDIEIVACFQDQEDHPEYLYIIQIPKAKFTTNDISQGAEELTVSLPFQSFEERACRLFRIRKKVVDCTLNNETGNIDVSIVGKPDTEDGLEVSAVLADGTELQLTKGTYADGVLSYTFEPLTANNTVIVTMKYNGKVKTNKYSVTV
jgi:hypothetical protein